MCIFRVLCAAGVFICATVSSVQAAAPTIQPGSWTLAILPDTQNYAERYPAVFHSQVDFLAKNKDALNLAFVLHEGDITNRNTPKEWEVASAAMNTLEEAGVPYSLVPGNHDYGPPNASVRTSNMAGYFPVARLKKQSTFGGVYPGEPDSPLNSYSLFSAGGTDWVVLALEFGPRDPVVEWADRVVKQHPNRRAIIVTHGYLYSDDTRYDFTTRGPAQLWSPYVCGAKDKPGGVNDGEEMWTRLKGNANLRFVFCGHVLNDGTGYLASKCEDGHVVHQLLANYQFLPEGGNGYLRLLEFMPDGETVHVRTYSPRLDSMLTAADQDFVLKVTPVSMRASCDRCAPSKYNSNRRFRRGGRRLGMRVPARITRSATFRFIRKRQRPAVD